MPASDLVSPSIDAAWTALARAFARARGQTYDGPVSLSLPDRVVWSAARQSHLCRGLGLGEPWSSLDPDEVGQLARDVRVVLHDSGSYGDSDRVELPGAWLRPSGKSAGLDLLWCSSCAFGPCTHKLAALVAVAHESATLRPWIRRPLWELQLLPLAVDASRATSPTSARRAQPHRGWIRYRLEWPPAAAYDGAPARVGRVLRADDVARTMRREVMRWAKGGDRALKPQRVPESFDELRARLEGPDDVDERVHDLLVALRAGASGRSRRGTSKDLSRALGLIARVLEALAEPAEDGPRDVWLGDRRVAVDAAPVTPTLVATPRPDGSLGLHFRPPVEEVLALQPPWIRVPPPTDDEADSGPGSVLRPLGGRFPEAALTVLQATLEPVPPDDVARFIEGFATRCPVPMTLEGPLPQARPGADGVAGSSALTEADTVEARLYLDERPRDTSDPAADVMLHLEPRLAYRVRDGLGTVAPDDGRPLVPVAHPLGVTTLARRRPDLEHDALAALEAALPRPWPTQLHGPEAYRFLAETLPTLRERWTVYGDAALKHHRVHSPATPSVAFHSGQDWFDLEVLWRSEGKALDGAAILKDWREGRTWHRLDGGGVARLPTRWLTRHAETLAELEELRRVAKGRLGLWATPVADPLLMESDGPERLRAWKERLATLRDLEGLPALPVPEGLRDVLRGYQVEGFRWLAFLRDHGLGGVLADDMGLGKTLQALALLADSHLGPEHADLAPGGRPSLVVAPASVAHTWLDEARRFVPDLRLHLHHGAGRTSLEEALRPDGGSPDRPHVVVTTYALLRLEQEAFAAEPWTTVLLDEAQAIKNPRSKVARSARSLTAATRIALTGTPLENHLVELWSTLHFLMPGFFGSREAFTKRYAVPIQQEIDPEALSALKRRVRPFLLRRLKREVAPELPPRAERIERLTLASDERVLYDQVRDTFRQTVLDSVQRRGVKGATLQVLEALTRLRQASCDARLVPFDEAGAVASRTKVTRCADLVAELADAGHRVLVFSQWPSLLDLVAEALDDLSVGHLRLDGSTRDRPAVLARWREPDGPPAFLVSLKAGGTGLTLTEADHVVHVDPWWNPAAEAQASDRAHRIGQTKPVVITKLVAADTVEERILALQAKKAKLLEAVVDRDRVAATALTAEDLEAVFAP